MKKAVLLVALIGVVVAAATGAYLWSWSRAESRRVPPGQPPLATLGAESLQSIRDAFNAHADETRLLVMLSPT